MGVYGKSPSGSTEKGKVKKGVDVEKATKRIMHNMNE